MRRMSEAKRSDSHQEPGGGEGGEGGETHQAAPTPIPTPAPPPVPAPTPTPVGNARTAMMNCRDHGEKCERGIEYLDDCSIHSEDFCNQRICFDGMECFQGCPGDDCCGKWINDVNARAC